MGVSHRCPLSSGGKRLTHPPCPGFRTVYDITARDTFESLTSWINELDTFAGTSASSRDVVRMIVGNKVDKEYSRVVSTAEGAAFAASRDPPWSFMECSAKQGGSEIIGEEGLFSRVVDQVRRISRFLSVTQGTPLTYALPCRSSTSLNSIRKCPSVAPVVLPVPIQRPSRSRKR